MNADTPYPMINLVVVGGIIESIDGDRCFTLARPLPMGATERFTIRAKGELVARLTQRGEGSVVLVSGRLGKGAAIDVDKLQFLGGGKP